MNFLSLVNVVNTKTLSIAVSAIAVISTIIYIFVLKNEIYSLKENISNLKIENHSLSFSNANLLRSVDSQNQAIEELNLKLNNKNTELKVTLKDLEEKYSDQLQQLENTYNSVEINDAENAIKWLRDRRY